MNSAPPDVIAAKPQARHSSSCVHSSLFDGVEDTACFFNQAATMETISTNKAVEAQWGGFLREATLAAEQRNHLSSLAALRKAYFMQRELSLEGGGACTGVDGDDIDCSRPVESYRTGGRWSRLGRLNHHAAEADRQRGLLHGGSAVDMADMFSAMTNYVKAVDPVAHFGVKAALPRLDPPTPSGATTVEGNDRGSFFGITIMEGYHREQRGDPTAIPAMTVSFGRIAETLERQRKKSSARKDDPPSIAQYLLSFDEVDDLFDHDDLAPEPNVDPRPNQRKRSRSPTAMAAANPTAHPAAAHHETSRPPQSLVVIVDDDEDDVDSRVRPPTLPVTHAPAPQASAEAAAPSSNPTRTIHPFFTKYQPPHGPPLPPQLPHGPPLPQLPQAGGGVGPLSLAAPFPVPHVPAAAADSVAVGDLASSRPAATFAPLEWDRPNGNRHGALVAPHGQMIAENATAAFRHMGGAPAPPFSTGAASVQASKSAAAAAAGDGTPPPGLDGFMSAAAKLARDQQIRQQQSVHKWIAGGNSTRDVGVPAPLGHTAVPRRGLGMSVPNLGLRRQPFVVPFAHGGGDDPPPTGHAPPTSAPMTTVGIANPAAAANANTSSTSSSSLSIGRALGAAVKSDRAPGVGGKSADGDGLADDPSRPPEDFPSALLLPDGTVPPILQNLEPKLVAQVASEIVECSGNRVTWDDIAGLEHAKSSVEEAIVWPLARPDLFVGLRNPPRGLLLFGPPGTGKTMIARAIASRAQCTFINISSSSLMSKWVGEGEKMVRCLFAVAVVKQPCVVFIDEIDSLLSSRSDGEMDAVRRVKTEFLVQLDGVATKSTDRVLVIGATNRPAELDEAARRRMVGKLYVPLPDRSSRIALLQRLLAPFLHSLGEGDFELLADATKGYSGADLKILGREASMLPLREQRATIQSVAATDIRPVSKVDFDKAIKRIRPSVAEEEVARYEAWNSLYGSFQATADA